MALAIAERRRRQLESKIRNQYKEILKTPKNPLRKLRSGSSDQQDRQARRDHVNNTAPVYIDDDLREKALSLYEHEIHNSGAYDLGNMGPNRYSLYKTVEKAIAGDLKLDKTKSSSNMSNMSRESQHEGKSNESVLSALVRERNTMAKLGFLERAEEIDLEIKDFTSKVDKERKDEERRIYKEQEVALNSKLERRSNRVIYELEQEEEDLENFQKAEMDKLMRKQVDEFTKLIEDTKRRAVGKAKTCNCASWYACTHNKSASYKTRRSKPDVIILKRNGDRLRRKGLTEEAQVWQAKALEMDQSHQQMWQQHMSQSIGAGSWGPNESILDKLIGQHKSDMNQLLEDQRVARTTMKVKHQRKREILGNVIKAKKNRLKVQVRKFYLNMLEERARLELLQDDRRQANFGNDLWDIMSDDMAEEQLNLQENAVKTTSKKGEGLKFEKDTQMYWGAMAQRTEEQEEWVPPTSTGLDNSDRLVVLDTDKKRIDTNLEATERELKARGYVDVDVDSGYLNKGNLDSANSNSNNGMSYSIKTFDSKIGFTAGLSSYMTPKDSIEEKRSAFNNTTFDSKVGFGSDSKVGFGDSFSTSTTTSPVAPVVSPVASISFHQPSPPIATSPSSSSLNSLNASIRRARIKEDNETNSLEGKSDYDSNNETVPTTRYKMDSFGYSSGYSSENTNDKNMNMGDPLIPSKLKAFSHSNGLNDSMDSLGSLGEFGSLLDSPMNASSLNASSNVSSASDISFLKDITRTDSVTENSDGTQQPSFGPCKLFNNISFGGEEDNSLKNSGNIFPLTDNTFGNRLDMGGFSSPMVSSPKNSSADLTQLNSNDSDSDTDSVHSLSVTGEESAGFSMGGGFSLGASRLFNPM